jgi:phosphate uptake regulator
MKIPEQILEEITGKVEQYEKGFVNGWETCARTIDEASDFFLKREGDLRKEIAELKAQLEKCKEIAERDGKDYSDLLESNKRFQIKIILATRALTEIIKEETNNQRPGGSYSRSYLLAYNAMEKQKQLSSQLEITGE